MGARSIPPPPMVVRRVLHVLWPLVGIVVTGLMVPVIVAGAFMVVVDRRARLFRASCLAVVLMWVDIRMLLGCWALIAAVVTSAPFASTAVRALCGVLAIGYTAACVYFVVERRRTVASPGAVGPAVTVAEPLRDSAPSA